MRSITLALIAGLGLLVSQHLSAQPAKAQTASEEISEAKVQELMAKLVYSKFKTTKYLMVGVQLTGSAEKLGLKKSALIDFAKLRLKNNIADIPMTANIPQDAFKEDSVALLALTVWTVGDDYPVAFHINISCGPVSKIDLYQTAILGYASKNKMERIVKESIDDLIQDFAIAFYKGRREM